MDYIFGFKGKIGRGGFALLFIASLVIYGTAALHITISAIRLLVMIVALIVYLSCIIRRLHDLGRKSYEILLLCIPFYGLYILFLLFFKKGVTTNM